VSPSIAPQAQKFWRPARHEPEEAKSGEAQPGGLTELLPACLLSLCFARACACCLLALMLAVALLRWLCLLRRGLRDFGGGRRGRSQKPEARSDSRDGETQPPAWRPVACGAELLLAFALALLAQLPVDCTRERKE
jgi:hypothetical protein